MAAQYVEVFKMLTGEGQRSREFDSCGKPKQSTEEGKKIGYS
jgi:hypothetical protein